MQSGYQEFQTYLRQTFPEFSELTAYEIYQLKKQDLNFINSASKYLPNLTVKPRPSGRGYKVSCPVIKL